MNKLKINVNMPPSLKEIEEQQVENEGLFDLSNININELAPYERNRLFLQLSDMNGDVSPDIHKITEQWVNALLAKDPDRYTPTTRPLKPNTLPRSKLVDTFFSHQIPGIPDSVLTDARRLVRTKNHIKRIAENGTRQTKLAMHHLNQIAPEARLLATATNGEYNPLAAISRLIEEDKHMPTLRVPSKVAQSTVSAILESSDGITADFTNGAYTHAHK